MKLSRIQHFLPSIISIVMLVSFVFGVPASGFAQTSTPIPANEDTGTLINDLDPCFSEQGAGDPNLKAGNPCKTSTLDIGVAIGTIIQFIFVIAVILALGFLVYGGIRWITSGGDKDGVASARGTIIAAIIGLIVVFLAYFILNFVLFFLTGNYITGLSIPSLNQLPGGDA